MGGAAVAYNASTQDDSSSSSSSPSPSGGGSGSGSNLISASKSVKMMCAQTDYRDACEKSLSKAAANASASSPKDIVRAAVAVIGDALGNAFNRSEVIKSNDPRVKAAVADCKEIYQNAKDDLGRTLHGIDASSMDGVAKRGYELRVLLSAVITHMETCIDGFPDGDLKKQMTDTMESGKELTSNALAIIEKASSVLVTLHIPGFTHRRLLGNNQEENMENELKVNHSGTFRGRDAAAPASDNRRLLNIDEEENMENEPKVKHSSTFLGELKDDVMAADNRRLLSIDEEENMDNQPKVKHSSTFLGELKDDVTAADNRRLLSVEEEGNMENQPKVNHSGTFLGELKDDVTAANNRRLLSVEEEGNLENQPKVKHSGGTFLGELKDDVAAAGNRRLLSIEEDTPQWVNGPERRLLKGNFQGKLKPNVVVAKDGSGKFKTINDALNAMPKQYTGRCQCLNACSFLIETSNGPRLRVQAPMTLLSFNFVLETGT
jgi:pectinesterase inhibitor-like protein